MKKVMNTGLILKGNKPLLGMKKRGFGEGRWNGFGGKVKEGKTIEGAMAIEFEEECNIKVIQSEKVGLIDFEFENAPVILEVHFYRIIKYLGEPIETEEMRPQWFSTNELPFEKMWPDDKHWMPIFLKGKKFSGKILFKDPNTIIKADLKEVNGF